MLSVRLFFVAALCLAPLACPAETLYNGITLPAQWPPKIRHYAREPMPVPYLLKPPAVIPIALGRQLFVDDFLIESTSLSRTFHSATIHPASPILIPDRPWEALRARPSDPPGAIPFSDGVWFDPQDQLFKMWYGAGALQSTCYATSRDGIHWTKPSLDVVPGTNIVLNRARNSATVWLDLEAANSTRRYVFHRRDDETNRHVVHYSADGIHWSEPAVRAGAAEDRSTLFYNPFRRKWVFGLRSVHVGEGETAAPEFAKDPRVSMGLGDFTRIGRMRRYAEGDTLEAALQSWPYPQKPPRTVDRQFLHDSTSAATPLWVGSDRLDSIRPDIGTPTELYNLDAVAYESLMVGFFSVWRGVPINNPGRDKINEICVGFSRDGFHWDRSYRQPLVGVSEDPRAWNYSNVQSVGGCFLIVGDQLYIYASGRQTRDIKVRPGYCSTGLATLRRDGFASMDATGQPGVLTTRPVLFTGKHLFVNVACPKGALRVEILDSQGNPVGPFNRENCIPIQIDSTHQVVRWRTGGSGPKDLAALRQQAVRFRFHLTSGRLYAFWVSPEESGTSQGYVAAGGPGFSGPRDTAGR